MTLRYRIRREILLLMASATVVSGLVVFFGTFIVFSLIWEYLPSLATDKERFTGTDFLTLAIVILPVLVLASLASFRLARRIVVPLNSLAMSARRIKNGDLSARAARTGTRRARPPIWWRISPPWRSVSKTYPMR